MQAQAQRNLMATYPVDHSLEKLASVATASGVRLGAQVHEIIGILLPITQDLGLGVVEQRHELAEVALPALGRQLQVEPPHARAEESQPVVRMLA